MKVKNIVKGAGHDVFKVDNTLKLTDEAAGVLVNGKYLKNPTAKNVTELIKNPSGSMKLDQNSNSILNGQYMYVVDEADNIIILSSNSYVRGRLLEFFKLSDNV